MFYLSFRLCTIVVPLELLTGCSSRGWYIHFSVTNLSETLRDYFRLYYQMPQKTVNVIITASELPEASANHQNVTLKFLTQCWECHMLYDLNCDLSIVCLNRTTSPCKHSGKENNWEQNYSAVFCFLYPLQMSNEFQSIRNGRMMQLKISF